MQEARQIMKAGRNCVDVCFQRHKGVLELQTRLTNVYDKYMGCIGDEEDPGELDDE